MYKGLLKRSFTENYTETVAVKTLKGVYIMYAQLSNELASLGSVGFLEKELVKDLLRECTKMIEFDHPNVLTLRGVCLDGGPAPYIIMPFMSNGSLLGYLKGNREMLFIDQSSKDLDDNREKAVKVKPVVSVWI